jgi:hypothetical protein
VRKAVREFLRDILLTVVTVVPVGFRHRGKSFPRTLDPCCAAGGAAVEASFHGDYYLLRVNRDIPLSDGVSRI